MVIFIESLIGIILFTIIIVALTLKDPLTSVGDYPPAIRDRCMELGLIEKIGLQEFLSPTRANGLLSMIKQFKFYAIAFQAKNNN